jgi:hypothetical protein
VTSPATTLQALERLPDALRDPHVADARLVTLPGNVPPWTDVGMRLARGEAFSILAGGRLVLAADLDLWMPPSLALWARIGGRGPLLNGTGDTASYEASHDGRLELAIYNGEWGATGCGAAMRRPGAGDISGSSDRPTSSPPARRTIAP